MGSEGRLRVEPMTHIVERLIPALMMKVVGGGLRGSSSLMGLVGPLWEGPWSSAWGGEGVPINRCGDVGAGGRDGGSHLDSSSSGLGLGGSSPRGGRGPGSPLGGWAVPNNHCVAVGRGCRGCQGGRGGLDSDLGGLAAVHSTKGTGVCFALSSMTWNCASLFGFAPRDEVGRKRYRSKMNNVINLAMSHDVVFLQEVHGRGVDLPFLGCYIPSHLSCGSLCSRKAAGGVLIITHPRVRQRYGDCWSMGAVHQGRATAVGLVDGRGGLPGWSSRPFEFVLLACCSCLDCD